MGKYGFQDLKMMFKGTAGGNEDIIQKRMDAVCLPYLPAIQT